MKTPMRPMLAAFATISCSVGSAAAPPFTIEQVMQAPYPSSLEASPTSKAVAWVFDDRGCRNVWVADASRGMQGRPVTNFTGDEGFDVGELAWAPDGHSLAFTRGQTLEDDLPANVNSIASGPVGRDVWVASVTGGPARRLGAGHSPQFSPDGRRLVFVDKNRLLAIDIDVGSNDASATHPAGTGDAAPVATPPPDAAVQTLIVDKGSISAFTFAPDGKRLAFVSERGSHSLIGLYELSSSRIQWLAPSLDHDSSAVFSPDGGQLAFIRVPAEKSPLFISRRSGQPWSIEVVDLSSLQNRRLWRADPGQGSVFNSTLSEQNLFWSAQGQLVFPWEKTGWLQLYAVPAKGGAARALTSGSFEVGHITQSPDRRRIVFSSNQDDGDRLHVWSLDPGSDKPKRASDGAGIEDTPQVDAEGTVYALRSEGTRPLQPVMLSRSGRWEPLAPSSVPASFPSSQLVMPSAVTFAAQDGQQAHGQLFVPKAGGSGPHPALLFFHGGPRRQMLLGFHPMGAYNWMYALNQYFTAKGYVVLSVNYRGGIGYGLDYREAKDFGPGGGSELKDLLGAVQYLEARRDVDPKRIGIWGGSYGGLMTALGLARDSADIAAGVDYAGVHDWASFMSTIGMPIEGADATRVAFESSPMATMDQWHSPVLIVQADDDRAVPSQQASELIEALRAHAIDHEEIIMPNEIHDLARYQSWMTLFGATDDYFERHLNQR